MLAELINDRLEKVSNNQLNEKEYQVIGRETDILTKQLEQTLSEEQRTLLRQITDQRTAYVIFAENYFYENGLRDGVKLIFDIVKK